MMKPEVRIPALGELGRVPMNLLSGFITSAFNGSELDKEYVDKYKNGYTAYLCDDAYATVLNAVRNNVELTQQAKQLWSALKEAGYISSEYDLASILNSGEMAFKPSDSDVLPDDADDNKSTIVLDADDKFVLSGHCQAVLNAYKMLYSNVFASKPPLGAYGLCPGHSTYLKGAIYTHSAEKGRDIYRSPDVGGLSSIRALYRGLGLDVLTESSKWSALELGADNSRIYSVRYMGRFAAKVVDAAKGTATSSKEFWQQLSDWVEKKLLSVYEAYLGQGLDEAWLAVSRASKNLVNAFIVEECDIRVSNLLLVKVCAPSVNIGTGETVMKELEQRMTAMGQQNIAIRAIEASDNNTGFTVYTIAMALNDVLEADAPSFAYQAWDDALSTGKSISEVLGTHNVIFGRHADGTQRTFNLADQNGKAHNMAVIAGAGSGKGLTTLATVGAAAARKEPLFYLDCKPEMSSILRKFMADHGKAGRVFAYDGQAIQIQLDEQIPGSNAKKYKPFELPYDIVLSDAAKNGLAICKAFALLLATMKYLSVEMPEDQKDRWATVGYSGVGGLAVFDELQLMNTLAWLPMKTAVEKIPNTKDKNPEYAAYVKMLKAYVTASEENITGAANALLRYSPISTLSLFQDFKYVTADKPVFQGLFRLQNLVGRVGDSSNDKTRRIANPRLYDALAKRKWAVAPSAANEVDLSTLSNPIKPYLVFGTPGDVKGYQKSDAWNALPEDYRASLDESKLNFIGLLTHPDYNIDLTETLAAGYDIAQHMLNIAGFGGTVEDFITSFQPEAMIGFDYSDLYKKAFKTYAAIKSGEIEYTNPPIAGTGPTPTPFVVGGDKTKGDYASKTNAETPEKEGEGAPLPFDNLDEEMGAPNKAVVGDPFGAETKVPDINIPETPSAEMPDIIPTNNSEDIPNTNQINEIGEGIPKEAVEEVRAAQTGGWTQPQPQPQPQPQGGQEQARNPALAQPFPQFQSIFQRQAPRIQQQTIQYQQLYGKPCVYAEDEGVFFVQDDSGLLQPVSGRYAVAPNIVESVYQNQRRANYAVMDNGELPFKEKPNGEVTTDVQAAYSYGTPVNGPQVVFKNKMKPIYPDMSVKKLESALAQRWYALMVAGGKVVGGANLVVRVTICEQMLYVNGLPIPETSHIISSSGLKVTDLVNYEEMFRYFKSLKQLDLDYVARISFGASYSKPSIPFTKYKSLQVINFSGSDGKITQFTRQHAAQQLQVPEDRLLSRFNTWTAFASQVNKGQTSAFCKPGNRLRMADYTKRLAVGAFGPGSTWSKKRRAFGAIAMLGCAAGTVVTGGIQAARAARVKHR